MGMLSSWWANLSEERVQAVDLLLLLHVGVELRDADQRQLFHHVDLKRQLHK